jgi:hypothetical protein
MKKRLLLALILFINSTVNAISNDQVIEQSSAVNSNIKKPFLRHVDGCKSVGIFNRNVPSCTGDVQNIYGGYYNHFINESWLLQFGFGLSPVTLYKNMVTECRYLFIPTISYTFHHANNNHYISVGLEPMLEVGPYRKGTIYMTTENKFDCRVNIVPYYTFYFKQYWSFYAGLGGCIKFLKNRGGGGLIGSFGIQYNF